MAGGTLNPAAWEELLAARDVPEEIHNERRWGLARNSAAPDEVLIRLLDHVDIATMLVYRRRQSPAVINAAVDHPEWRIRALTLETGRARSWTERQWSNALRDPALERRKAALVLFAAETGAQLPDDREHLAHDKKPSVRRETANLTGLPANLRLLLAADPDPAERMSQDPQSPVRQRAAKDPRLPVETIERLLADSDSQVRACAAENPALPPTRIIDLLCTRNSAHAAAANPALPIPVMHRVIDLAAASSTARGD